MNNSVLESKDLVAIIDSLSDAVVVYDADLRVVMVNKKLSEYAGMDGGILIGTTPEQHLKDGLIQNTIVRKVLDSRHEITGTILTDTGFYSSRCRPIFDDAGEIKYIVSTASSLGEINVLQEMLHNQAEQNERYLREVQQLRKALLTDEFVYASKHMEKVLDTIKKVAAVDCNVMITGESGVGKDIAAHTIHSNSPRRDGPYLSLNIPAIPDSLLEAELFGYEEGAFTGSVKGGKMGLLEAAKGGTILLDEIGYMPYHLQVKILRAIERGEIMRLGSTKPIKLDVRILAATNRNIQEAIMNKEFRSDLYYRLNVVAIHIKPLRERREDIRPLGRYFLHKSNDKYGQTKSFNIDALEEMDHYFWPGNVRELKNTVERLTILSEGDCISAADVKRVLDVKKHAVQKHLPSVDVDEQEGIYADQAGKSLQQSFDDYERQLVLEALKSAKGNKSTAAKQLGISRGKLYRLLQE
ncbi:MAG TPA: sigma 54-interacting transcriptional regulator [Syntrophomonas sp.]|nr:sigma 54-interacting transcriptional regulator [Syntrophomonas sp.]